MKKRTENIELEKFLCRTEGMFHSLLQTIPDLVWLKDLNGKFLACNSMFESYFGASEAEILGKTDYDFVDPGLADFYRENDRKAMLSGGPSMNEEWITFADGRQALLETIKTPMYDKNGELIGILGIGHDITRRKHTEEILRENEEKFHALFEQAGDYALILEYDKQKGFVITDINEAAIQFHGYSREEIIGQPITMLDVGTDKAEVSDIAKRLFQGETLRFETIHRRKDDSRFPVEVTAKAVQLSGRTIILSTERNITERKEVESLLIREKEAAQSADKLKSSFLATMSHELRTPLNSIIGFSGILLQGMAGPLSEEQRKQLNMIQTSGQRLLALINDILDLSKIEAGQIKIIPTHFNLYHLLQEIVKMEEPVARTKGNSITLVSSKSFSIISDKQRLQQILFNLLDNAIKFTENGSIKINCYTEKDSVIIEVADTGIGIREEDLDKLFKPFVQIENYIARKYQGSGLGLSICKKLTQLLGGTINVKSQFNVGSTFTIVLPRKFPDSFISKPVANT